MRGADGAPGVVEVSHTTEYRLMTGSAIKLIYVSYNLSCHVTLIRHLSGPFPPSLSESKFPSSSIHQEY